MKSLYAHTGISMEFYNPVPLYNSVSDAVYKCERYRSYTHEIGAIGGFLNCGIGIPVNVDDAEVWYQKGLGRKVKSFNHHGKKIFQGFVNHLTISAGASSVSLGPLVNIGNIVGAKYTPIDYSEYPPTVGDETSTLAAEDETSQGMYGQWEKWIAISGVAEEAAAEQVRDVFLKESAYPQSNDDTLSILGASTPDVTLNCVGDIYWLAAYIYNNLVGGNGFLSDKIKAILDADPNGVISSDYNFIEDNLYPVNLAEDEDRYALDIIKGLLALGNGVDDSRMLFGVYEEGLVRYSAIPTEIEYYHYLSDPSRKITTSDMALIPPWEILPGKWIQVPDFTYDGIQVIGNLRSDKRNKFIDTVRFTAPNSVDLSGGKNDRLSQMLAKIAYSGGVL